jgi:hypothetical protein
MTSKTIHPVGPFARMLRPLERLVQVLFVSVELTDRTL